MPRFGTCTSCSKVVQLTRTSSAEPYCRPCRAAGRAPSRAQHGTSGRYRSGCRCETCRTYKRDAMRRYTAKRRAEGRPIVYAEYRSRESRTCEQCRSEFLARTDNAGRFCSSACVGLSQRAADGKRARRRSKRRRQAEAILAAAAAGTSGGARVWVQGACLVCDEQFLSPGLASRYCSRECRAVARSSRSWISYEDRRAIYVRDAWACQICREPTSRRYSMSDPWSPTLDHVVPRSRGGSDDPTNLRLSHLWCNSVRGDLSHYTDADLQGVT